MSGDAAVKFDRAELERFAAQRHLPEAVLAQLRARAKNEIEPAAGWYSHLCKINQTSFSSHMNRSMNLRWNI